jgi:hypothetical protein
LKEGRVYFSIVNESPLWEDSIVVLGGYDGENVLKSCERFNIGKNQWEKFPDMNIERMYFGCVANQKANLIAMGGFDKAE